MRRQYGTSLHRQGLLLPSSSVPHQNRLLCHPRPSMRLAMRLTLRRNPTLCPKPRLTMRRSQTLSNTCTSTASCTGTSSPPTCWWGPTGRSSWATSAWAVSLASRPWRPFQRWARPTTSPRRSCAGRATTGRATCGAWAACSMSWRACARLLRCAGLHATQHARVPALVRCMHACHPACACASPVHAWYVLFNCMHACMHASHHRNLPPHPLQPSQASST